MEWMNNCFKIYRTLTISIFFIPFYMDILYFRAILVCYSLDICGYFFLVNFSYHVWSLKNFTKCCRLEDAGYAVGARVLELLCHREKVWVVPLCLYRCSVSEELCVILTIMFRLLNINFFSAQTVWDIKA